MPLFLISLQRDHKTPSYDWLHIEPIECLVRNHNHVNPTMSLCKTIALIAAVALTPCSCTEGETAVARWCRDSLVRWAV
jgi:hypothetical protein